MAPKKKGSLAQRIKKIFSEDESGAATVDLEALAEAAKEPGAAAAFDKAGSLVRAAERGSLEAFELILASGASTAADASAPAACQVAYSSLAPAARVRALELLVERGADLEACNWLRMTALDHAVETHDGGPVVRYLLSRPLSLTTRANALCVAIRAAKPDCKPAALDAVDAMLGAVEDKNAPGRDGFSPIHAAALTGNPAVIARVLDAGASLDRELDAAATLNANECSPPGGGIVPQIRFPAGLTALDLVERTLELYQLKHQEFASAASDYNRPARAAKIAALETSLSALRDRGARRGKARRDESDPPFRAELDAILDRLCDFAGGDRARLDRLREGMSLQGRGPWGYLTDVIERAQPILLRGPMVEAASRSWLGWLIERGSGGSAPPRVHASDYPEEARACLKQDLVVGRRDDGALLCLWKQPDNTAKVCAVSADAFEVLGVDVVDFARREAARLCGEAVPASRASADAKGTGATMYRVMVADREHAPSPTTINRIGGLPIGFDAASWPTKDGKHLYHVLTIDLNDHPTYRPAGARALALFVTHPSNHGAWNPRNTDTRVVLLSEADLARGEPAWPADLDPNEGIPAATFTFDDEPRGDEERFKHSFAGWMPVWLQGDETEDEYDGDEGDDDEGGSDVEAPSPPRNFVLQFGGELVDMNLGDCGVMYVYAECAWFQCY